MLHSLSQAYIWIQSHICCIRPLSQPTNFVTSRSAYQSPSNGQHHLQGFFWQAEKRYYQSIFFWQFKDFFPQFYYNLPSLSFLIINMFALRRAAIKAAPIAARSTVRPFSVLGARLCKLSQKFSRQWIANLIYIYNVGKKNQKTKNQEPKQKQ